MRPKWTRLPLIPIFLPIILLLACVAFSQTPQASLTIAITTSDETELPGVMVTLASDTFSNTLVTDAQGKALFANLNPDIYEFKAVFAGFQTIVRPNILVHAGDVLTLNLILHVASNQEGLFFGCLLEPYEAFQVGTQEDFSGEELTEFPHARDPWAILETIPGIQLDRVNVGGNETGQQPFFTSKGDDGTNTTWLIEGVDVTDHASEGALLSFVDFGALDYFRVVTGGADIPLGGSGAVIQMETKNGTNEHRGSMRLLFTDQDFQASPQPQDRPGSNLVEVFEKGIEIGGPIIVDKLWYWGAFQQTSVATQTGANAPDASRLENLSFKLRGDLTSSTRLSALYTEGDKQIDARGAGNFRAPETTWRQTSETPIAKIALSQLIGNRTELELIYARVDHRFTLAPQVSPDLAQPVFNQSLGRWENSYRHIEFSKPSRQYEVKGLTFLNFGGVDHEFEYGFKYKNAWSIQREHWGTEGSNLWVSDYSGLGQTSYFFAHRDLRIATELENTSAWLRSAVDFGNLSLVLGLRYNISDSQNFASENIPGNPLFPQAVPSLAYRGDDPQFEYKTFAPRMAASYPLGERDQFLFRGSYRRYYDEISVNESASINPAGRAWITGYSQDFNGDGQYDETELGFALDADGQVIPYRGNEATQDPYAIGTHGLNISSVGLPKRDRIDPDLKPPRVDEFILDGTWELKPHFLLGLSFTHRRKQDFHWNLTRLGSDRYLDSDDYIRSHVLTGTHPQTGQPWEVDFYTLSPEAESLRLQFGESLLTNRPDYTETFRNLELTASKRLSNGWMMRGHLALQDWTRDVGPNGILNPTPDAVRSNVDGSDVAIASTGQGDKADIFPGTATWTASVYGFYQLPWDMAISGLLTAREGYQAPLFLDTRGFLDGSNRPGNQNISIGTNDSYRYDDLVNFNLKLSKALKIGSSQVELALEVFNLFNEHTVLQQQRSYGFHQNNGAFEQNFEQAGTVRPNFLRNEEYLSPRVGRFTVTIHF